MFNDSTEGLYHVIDNICKDMKSEGVCNASHNCLSTEDIFAIYDSERLPKEDSLGFITRIIFNLAFLTGWRPGALEDLEM